MITALSTGALFATFLYVAFIWKGPDRTVAEPLCDWPEMSDSCGTCKDASQAIREARRG